MNISGFKHNTTFFVMAVAKAARANAKLCASVMLGAVLWIVRLPRARVLW